jgi:hypothetical protein
VANLIFIPGSTHTASVSITVVPTGLTMQLEVWLASSPTSTTKIVTSGLRSFTSTGAAQTVTAPVTMPVAGGPYTVNIDVFYGGVEVAGFQGTDTISTLGVSIGPITWV